MDDEDLGENDIRDDIPGSDLLLCDKCPRAFCVRCVMLSLGGDRSAWEEVKKVVQSDDEWVCCKCQPTSYLEKLQSAYKTISCSSPSPGRDSDDGEKGENDSKDDDYIQKLLDELDYAEYSLEDATQMLDNSNLEKERDRIEQECMECMMKGGTSLEDIEGEVEKELASYKKKWQLHFDRFADTIARLQDELSDEVMQAFYRYRAEKKGEKPGNSMILEDYKISADLALGKQILCIPNFYVISYFQLLEFCCLSLTEKRDKEEGFNKGEFKGASGYKPKDPRVLKLEPEDLNAACLNEIEDVNTMEGAISQMQSNANARGEMNPWRSKTGTTELDIEM